MYKTQEILNKSNEKWLTVDHKIKLISQIIILIIILQFIN